MKIGRFSTITLVLVSLFSLGVLVLLFFAPRPYLFGVGSLADLFGFLALALIVVTGVLMLFKRPLTTWMGSPERLWRLHIVIAGAGGLFLGLHVVLFLAFPLSLPVLLGYGATGAALFVWVTGGIYFQGVRNSMFYHGLLSIGAIFLMTVHTFGAGRNIPVELSGFSLALIAIVVLAGVTWQLVKAWKSDGIARVRVARVSMRSRIGTPSPKCASSPTASRPSSLSSTRGARSCSSRAFLPKPSPPQLSSTRGLSS